MTTNNTYLAPSPAGEKKAREFDSLDLHVYSEVLYDLFRRLMSLKLTPEGPECDEKRAQVHLYVMRAYTQVVHNHGKLIAVKSFHDSQGGYVAEALKGLLEKELAPEVVSVWVDGRLATHICEHLAYLQKRMEG